jgi:predicted kinase
VHAMIMTVGAPGSGKSTVCDYLRQRGATVLSLDEARGFYGGHFGDQRRTPQALRFVASQTVPVLGAECSVVLDGTFSRPEDRAVWLGIAGAQRAATVALVFRGPVGVCLERNASRSRRVPVDVVEAKAAGVAEVSDDQLWKEGFDHVAPLPLEESVEEVRRRVDEAVAPYATHWTPRGLRPLKLANHWGSVLYGEAPEFPEVGAEPGDVGVEPGSARGVQWPRPVQPTLGAADEDVRD